jgi:hypothetical protein
LEGSCRSSDLVFEELDDDEVGFFDVESPLLLLLLSLELFDDFFVVEEEGAVLMTFLILLLLELFDDLDSFPYFSAKEKKGALDCVWWWRLGHQAMRQDNCKG